MPGAPSSFLLLGSEDADLYFCRTTGWQGQPRTEHFGTCWTPWNLTAQVFTGLHQTMQKRFQEDPGISPEMGTSSCSSWYRRPTSTKACRNKLAPPGYIELTTVLLY